MLSQARRQDSPPLVAGFSFSCLNTLQVKATDFPHHCRECSEAERFPQSLRRSWVSLGWPCRPEHLIPRLLSVTKSCVRGTVGAFLFSVSLKLGLHLSVKTSRLWSAPALSGFSFQLPRCSQQQLLCLSLTDSPARKGRGEKTYPLKIFLLSIKVIYG